MGNISGVDPDVGKMIQCIRNCHSAELGWACDSDARVPAQHAHRLCYIPVLNKLAVRVHVIPGLGRWRQRDQKFKVIFNYIMTLIQGLFDTLSQK